MQNENIYYALVHSVIQDEVDSVCSDINGDTYSYYNNYSFTESNRMFVSLLASIELSGGKINGSTPDSGMIYGPLM